MQMKTPSRGGRFRSWLTSVLLFGCFLSRCFLACGFLGCRGRRRFLQHVFNDLVQLGAVLNLNGGSCSATIANYENCGRMLQANLRSHLPVGQDLGFELAIWIENKRYRRLVAIGKLVVDLPQVLLMNLLLGLENIAAEVIAKFF